MKQILMTIFCSVASIAAGLSVGLFIGVQINMVETYCVLEIVAAAVAGVFYLAGLMMIILLVRDAKRRKNAGNVALQKKDFVLQAGATYSVGKRGDITPGEYKVIASDENHLTFTIRVNDYVQEYRHNTTLVLAEGNTISARSANVILR